MSFKKSPPPLRVSGSLSRVPREKCIAAARRQVSAQLRETQVQTAPGGISGSELSVLGGKQVFRWLSTVIWECFTPSPTSLCVWGIGRVKDAERNGLWRCGFRWDGMALSIGLSKQLRLRALDKNTGVTAHPKPMESRLQGIGANFEFLTSFQVVMIQQI